MSRFIPVSAVLAFAAGCATFNTTNRVPGPLPGANGSPTLAPVPNVSNGTSPSDSGPRGTSRPLTPTDPFNSLSEPDDTSGPVLQMPEARRKKPAPELKTSQVQAPEPGRYTSNFRPTLPASQSMSRQPAANWLTISRSTDRRAIETLTLGTGSRRILVLSSLHGDELQSVSVVEQLARDIPEHRGLLASSTMVLVRSPNPDGLYTRSPLNVNAVDLNRNFPAANWRALPNHRGGERPGSEPETQVLLKLIDNLRPQLIVHVKDASNDGLVNYDGETGRELAERAARQNKLKVTHDLGQKTSGSIEAFAVSKTSASAITLLLPSPANAENYEGQYQAALLAVLGLKDHEIDATRLGEGGDPFPGQDKSAKDKYRPARHSVSNALDFDDDAVTVAPAGKTRKTSETRPKNAKQVEFPAAVPAHGYLELPPPDDLK